VAVIAARRRPDLHWQPRHSDHERHRLDGPDPPQPSSLRRVGSAGGLGLIGFGLRTPPATCWRWPACWRCWSWSSTCRKSSPFFRSSAG